MIESKNPYTGESIEKFEELSKEQIDEVLDNAQQRYKLWRKTTMSERAEFMNNAAMLINNIPIVRLKERDK